MWGELRFGAAEGMCTAGAGTFLRNAADDLVTAFSARRFFLDIILHVYVPSVPASETFYY